ncbi:hypothetical protein MKL09_07515 [Methylobacterium sp. J-048]|uniref:hypothetical protein n=1 Tax=Methylobacterium sp. J-048 TaxID=2836635 RepID=UPI001FB99338|nr:hypothetical protein [Methylobacterium sp. J-048]MCJ2056397.1 hypothetical protein [Methylobacterium sp. J-048]
MARPTASSSNVLRAAALADAMATDMASTAEALACAGDPETAETLRALARHNRVLALKIRTTRGLAQDRIGLARIF